jgi:choline kinase
VKYSAERARNRETVEAIVLAAGKGSRLLPLTVTVPKPLVNLPEGGTILQHQLDALQQIGTFEAIRIIAGYKIQDIRNALAEESDGNCVVEFNPFYSVAGALGSLWVGLRASSEHDVVILNGDTLLFESSRRGLAELLAEDREGVTLIVSEHAHGDPDAMEVACHPDGRVLAVGKGLPAYERKPVSVGILVVRGKAAREAADAALDRLLVDSQEALQQWPWHSIVNALVAMGCPVRTSHVPPGSWLEIDSLLELKFLERGEDERS